MTTTALCSICSGTGIDPGFLDPCICQDAPPAAPRRSEARQEPQSSPTEKQQAFAERLLSELAELQPDRADHIEKMRAEFRTLSPKHASTTIDFFLKVVREVRSSASAQRSAALEPGLYRTEGKIVKVAISRSSGHPYASILNEATKKYEFVAGALRHVSASDRMSIDEAIVETRRIGRCCVCCRELKNPDSVDAGIGPICAGKI